MNAGKRSGYLTCPVMRLCGRAVRYERGFRNEYLIATTPSPKEWGKWQRRGLDRILSGQVKTGQRMWYRT